MSKFRKQSGLSVISVISNGKLSLVSFVLVYLPVVILLGPTFDSDSISSVPSSVIHAIIHASSHLLLFSSANYLAFAHISLNLSEKH